MTVAAKLIALSGNVHQPSRTAALVGVTHRLLSERTGSLGELFEIADLAPLFLSALTRDKLTREGEEILRRIEAADILVFGSPIYRATYTGAIKHLFDMVDYQALRGLVVIPIATARLPGHALALEHQFRPMFDFFGAITTPTAVFASDADFDGMMPTNPAVLKMLERAVDEAVRLQKAGLRIPAPTA